MQTELQNIPVINVWSGALSDPMSAVVNEYSVLSIPAFWCGVRFLSETLASLPKSIYRRAGAARQPLENHPQNRLLNRRANQYTTPFVVFETWHAHAVVHGNGYIFVKRDPNTSAPIGYYNLNPDCVTPFRYGGQQWFAVRGSVDDTTSKNLTILPAADVLHLPGLGFDGMCGYPVVSMMYEALELARNSQRFASKYLRKGTQVQGSIEIPGTATKEQIDAVVDRMRRNHSGIDSDYNFTVLTGGAKLNNATIPPEQSQLLQSRQFAVIDMCRILRVPPHTVYDLGRATWSNVESMGIEVVKYSLRPWVEKAEQELSSKILTQIEQDSGCYVRYSVDSLLRGDTQTQTSTTLSLVNGGIITANEGRAQLDLPPLADELASKLRVPVNFPVPATTKSADPTPTPSNSDEDDSFARTKDKISFAALAPIINDAVKRVEIKTTKAFANKSTKPQREQTIWANVFAEEQAKFVIEVLAPLNTVLSSTGRTLNVEQISERYAASIRSRAGGVEHKSLAQIVDDAVGVDLKSGDAPP